MPPLGSEIAYIHPIVKNNFEATAFTAEARGRGWSRHAVQCLRFSLAHGDHSPATLNPRRGRGYFSWAHRRTSFRAPLP
jgi:hypothetical protein